MPRVFTFLNRSGAGLADSWRQLRRGALGSGITITARGIGTLALNKLVAVYGDAGSLTQLAQFQNLLALLTALPAEGVQLGAITYLAPLQPGRPRHRLWLATALWATAATVAAGTAVLVVAGGPAWPPLRSLVVGAGVLLLTGQTLLGAALLAAGRPLSYAGHAATMALLGPAAVGVALALDGTIVQLTLAYLGGQVLAAPLAVGLARRAGMLRGHLKWMAPSYPALRLLGGFLLVALGTLLFGRAVDYAVRDYIVAHFAPLRADEWQAVARISDLGALVLGAGLGTVFFPRLAALAGAPLQQRRFLLGSAGALAVGLALVLAALYVARFPVLTLLFAPQLSAAAVLMAPQLVGDWARFISWAFQYQLLAARRVRTYLAVQAISAVLYVGLLALWVPTHGLKGVVVAHAGRYGAILVVSVALVLLKRPKRFQLNSQN